MLPPPRVAALLIAAVIPPLLPGCFAGSIGVALGIVSTGDGGKKEAADAPRAFDLDVGGVEPGSPRAHDLSQVQISFRLANPAGASTMAKVEFAAGQAAGVIAEREFAASREGVRHEVLWDAAAAGLTGYQRALITVTPRRGNTGGIPATTEAAIGNDPPVAGGVRVSSPGGGPVNGNATITFDVADSAGDPSAIAVLVARQEGEGFARVPDAHLIAGLAERFSPGTHSLTWDTAATLGRADLAGVVVGIEPDDRLAGGAGARHDSGPFHLDNNSPPAAMIRGAFALHPDQRRGIPVPFHVEDGEGDDLLLVFQWRPASAPDFLPLPEGRPAMEAILADPVTRRCIGIATELPPAHAGRLAGAGSSNGERLRLPELAADASPLVAGGLAGREVEVLRAPEAAAAAGVEGLDSPAAVVPIGDGLTALVLDRGAGGTWRLREIELATGEVKRPIVPDDGAPAAPGNPTAMALEPDGVSVLAALEFHGIWWVVRVPIATGAWDLVARRGPATPTGAVRGIAALGGGGAVITTGDALVRIHPGGRATTVIAGLATPWGAAADPLRPERVYVAERERADGAEAGRVSLVDLATLAVTPVARLPRPESIALERGGSRLLAVTDAGDDGIRELMALDLAAPGAEPIPLASSITGGAGGLATGRDGLRVLALTALDSYALAGGVAARRRILDHDPARGEVRLDSPITPPPAPGSRWRIFDRARRGPGPAGALLRREDVFIWDSRDAAAAGEVIIRLTPYDAERGTASSSTVPKRIVAPLEVEPAVLGGAQNLDFVQAGDLNRDGLPDIAAASGANAVAVYFQRRDASFGREAPGGEPGDCPPREPDLLLGSAATTNLPRGLALADLDADGGLDVVAANRGGNTLAVFSQKEDGVFGKEAGVAVEPDAILGGAASTAAPEFVLAADLDADGDLDLVSANETGGDLAAFLQRQPGRFGAPAEGGAFAPDFILGRDGPGARGPIALAAGDLDGDGDADLIAANHAASDLAVYLRKAPGEFGRPGTGSVREPDQVLGGPDFTREARSLALADFDRDGNLDAAAAAEGGPSFEGSGLALMFQESPGRFRQPLLLKDADGIGRPRAVVAGDLDGDGDLDLAGGNGSGNRIAVLYQREPGMFGARGEDGAAAADLTLGGAGTTDGPRSIVLADLDLNGRLDIVSANPRSFNVTVFFQRGPWDASAARCGERPEEEARVAFGSRVSTLEPVALAAADLDLDGDLDLAAANLEGMSLAAFLQDDRGAFAEGAILRAESGILAPHSVAAADIDGDGVVDLLAANPAGGDMALFRAGAGGIADASAETRIGGPAVTPSPRAAIAADLDGDGDLDLASANEGGDNLAVFLQRVPGGFGREGDGRSPDAQLGGEAWTRKPVALAAADIDADGDLDLACAAHGDPMLPAGPFAGSGLAVFLQKEPGRFGAPAEGGAFAPDFILGGPQTTRAPTAIAADDLDGDGRIDVAAANLGGDLTVFHQEEAGGFPAAPVAIPVTGPRGTLGPVSVAAADLDQDGRLDLVSANDFGEGDLAVFLQRGWRSFAPPLAVGGGGVTRGPASVLALDLDGDGDADLVSANSRGDNLTLFPGGR